MIINKNEHVVMTAACHAHQRLQGGVGREALADAARPGVADFAFPQTAMNVSKI